MDKVLKFEEEIADYVKSIKKSLQLSGHKVKNIVF